MFLIGMVLTILVIKPTVGVAVASSISDGVSKVAAAMQDRDRERDRERAEDLRLMNERAAAQNKNSEEFQVRLLTMFDKIIDKLDSISFHPDAKNTLDPKEEVVDPELKSKVSPVTSFPEEKDDKISTKEFDNQFGFKYTLR